MKRITNYELRITGCFLTVLRSYGLLSFSLLPLLLSPLYAQVNEKNILTPDFLQKNELIVTPELEEIVVSEIYSHYIDYSDEDLSKYGIKNRTQLENLQLGKPIPEYWIIDDNLIFRGEWLVPMMFDGEPFLRAKVKLKDNGQYNLVGYGARSMAKAIHNYEYKDLIIGSISFFFAVDYLIIRKENKDIFVQMYDYTTREYLKNEYNFSEVLNLLKK